MTSFADRMNLLTDLRDVVLLENTIESLNQSIDLLQDKVDKHPISKYKKYRPKNDFERREYEMITSNLAKIVSPLHRIIPLRDELKIKEVNMKNELQTKYGKSFDELFESLEEVEKALVNSKYQDSMLKSFEVEENNEVIPGFELGDYQQENERKEMVK